MQKKILILRLSSLGDVILASSALEVSKTTHPDWVVSQEYAELLRGHPNIGRVISFDRSKGFKAWLTLLKQLWGSEYTEVLDLHQNLRTLLARTAFFFWGLFSRRRVQWKTIHNPRWKARGFFIFKQLWAQRLRPTHWARASALAAGGTGKETPNLRHLINENFQSPFKKPFVALMPSSRWRTKEWAPERFAELADKLSHAGYDIAVLGSAQDQASLRLADILKQQGTPHVSGVGAWSLKDAANILSRAHAFVGNDTGLFHLAEAVGTKAFMIQGPTVPELGYGPSQVTNRSLGKNIWCRPCSKTGRLCHRLTRRHRCLNELSSAEILAGLDGHV